MFSWHLAAEAADVIIITIMVLIIMTHFSARLIIMAAAVIMITTIITMAAGKIFMQAQFSDCASFFVMRRVKERLDKSGDFHIIIIGN